MSKKYNYGVVRTETVIRLMYAENDEEMRELYGEGIVDDELSYARKVYTEYTFYRIDSDGEYWVDLLEKDKIDSLTQSLSWVFRRRIKWIDLM